MGAYPFNLCNQRILPRGDDTQTYHQGPEKSLSDEGVHELGVKLQKGEEDRIPDVKDKMS